MFTRWEQNRIKVKSPGGHFETGYVATCNVSSVKWEKICSWLEAVKPGFYMWNKVQLLRQSELSVDHWLASVCVSAAIYIHELSRYSGMRLLLWEPWEVRGQTAAEVKTVQVETGSSKTWSADRLRGCCGNRVLRADWLLGLIRTGGRISPRRKNVWSHQNFQSKTGKVSS